jgi:hypothetical protein
VQELLKEILSRLGQIGFGWRWSWFCYYIRSSCCCWPRWRGEELLAVGRRMRAFCVVGGEELLAVSWREGLGVSSGEWNVKIQNAGWEAWKNCFAKTWGWTSFLMGPMNQIAASFFNQTPYYLCLNKNAAATAKTNGL